MQHLNPTQVQLESLQGTVLWSVDAFKLCLDVFLVFQIGIICPLLRREFDAVRGGVIILFTTLNPNTSCMDSRYIYIYVNVYIIYPHLPVPYQFGTKSSHLPICQVTNVSPLFCFQRPETRAKATFGGLDAATCQVPKMGGSSKSLAASVSNG